MTVDRVADALAVAAGAALAWRWRRTARAWGWVEHSGIVVLALGLFVFARVAGRVVVGALALDWNGARLAPTVGLAHGYRLYYPASEGPVLDTIYGPVAALAYLPVALFRSPTPTILAGAALNLAFVTLPLLAFALAAAGRDAAGEPRAIAAWLGVCVLMTWLPGPYYWLSMTHADGPALALGLLACLVLLPGPGPRSPGTVRLGAAALLATLAAWAKQTSAPVGLALVAFVAWAYGRRAAGRYAIALGIATLATAAVFLWLFGPEPMWFNLVTVPGRQPWYFPGGEGLLHVLGWMLRAARPALVVLAVGVAARLVRGAGPWTTAAAPLLPALALVPTGLLAANKFGGNENSFHSVYFLFAAALALLVADGSARPTRARASGLAVYAVTLAGVLVAWRGGYAKLRGPAPAVFPNPHQQAYEFARAHPDEAYFPGHPLSTLLADGKLYHFAYGVIDRTLGGSPPSPAHFRANLPSHLEYVVVRGGDRKTMDYLPEFTETRTSPELPGWTLLTRPDGAATRQRARTSATRSTPATSETRAPRGTTAGRYAKTTSLSPGGTATARNAKSARTISRRSPFTVATQPG